MYSTTELHIIILFIKALSCLLCHAMHDLLALENQEVNGSIDLVVSTPPFILDGRIIFLM